MPGMLRAKIGVEATVGDWWENRGGVGFVVHGIYRDGGVERCRQLMDPVMGTNPRAGPPQHPDQQYWNVNNLGNYTGWFSNNGHQVLRYEVDVSIAPCDDNSITRTQGCASWLQQNLPTRLLMINADNIWVFTHRDPSNLSETLSGNKKVWRLPNLGNMSEGDGGYCKWQWYSVNPEVPNSGPTEPPR